MGVPRPSFGKVRMNPFAQCSFNVNLDALFLIDHVVFPTHAIDEFSYRVLGTEYDIAYTSPNIRLIPFQDFWLPISVENSASFLEVLSDISLQVSTIRPGD